eukprot:Seg3343.2 transcript_id=Seg3343.2/GoldUCD/mRNA.D3Y31 product="Mesoderm-specific transcript protein" protein_id=Seg3343.2/GoldUCD/D3Y31
MANRREKRSGKLHRPKISIRSIITSLLTSPKTIIIYFCLPFAFSLLFGLFISSPRPEFSADLSNWRDSGYTHVYKGFEIFYQDVLDMKVPKTKPNLLLLHGFPTSSFDWKKVLPSLVKYFGRIIAIDMLGFGFSDKPQSHNYTVLEQALIHEEILKISGIETVHLLAHDLGDTVAQEMLARYHERVQHEDDGLTISSLCLTNGGIFPETHHPRLAQQLLRLPIIGDVAAFLMNYLMFRVSFSAIFGHTTKPDSNQTWDFWTAIRYKDGHIAAPRLLNYIDERRRNRDRWVGALETTHVPLHYIYGSLDPVNPEDALHRYKTLIKNSTITEMPNVGHYPHWEDPKGFLDGYFEFLKRIGVRNDQRIL